MLVYLAKKLNLGGMKMREIKIKCKFCGKIQAVNVDENRYRKWVDGELIQRAMPDLNDFERESLISELCYDCQSKIYNMIIMSYTEKKSKCFLKKIQTILKNTIYGSVLS